jgi:3-oxoacyl-[acyl-carrier protein] reductase
VAITYTKGVDAAASNNAGTAIAKRFEETTLEELDRLIDINVRGIFVAT